jgi:predicted kinase
MKKLLIVVTGCPGSGKSSFSKRLSQFFPGMQLLAYDDVKETYFDRCGFADEREKELLNQQSLKAFYRLLDEKMAEGESVMIEYPFCKKHEASLRELVDRHGYRAITLRLTGDLRTLYQRGLQRDQTGGRHPGHLLKAYHKGCPWGPEDLIPPMEYEKFTAVCGQKDYAIQVGATMNVDVTDVDCVDTRQVYESIKHLLEPLSD